MICENVLPIKNLGFNVTFFLENLFKSYTESTDVTNKRRRRILSTYFI